MELHPYLYFIIVSRYSNTVPTRGAVDNRSKAKYPPCLLSCVFQTTPSKTMHFSKSSLASVPLGLCYALSASAAPNLRRATAVNTTTCNGKTYVYEELAGYGFLPSNARDKEGDTLGGIGSSIAIDKNSWKKSGNSYTGTLYALPDRGWNVRGSQHVYRCT